MTLPLYLASVAFASLVYSSSNAVAVSAKSGLASAMPLSPVAALGVSTGDTLVVVVPVVMTADGLDDLAPPFVAWEALARGAEDKHSDSNFLSHGILPSRKRSRGRDESLVMGSAFAHRTEAKHGRLVSQGAGW